MIIHFVAQSLCLVCAFGLRFLCVLKAEPRPPAAVAEAVEEEEAEASLGHPLVY